MRYLSVAHCQHVTDRTIQAAAERCQHLRYLNASGCPQVTDRGLVAVAVGSNRLEAIAVGHCPLVGDRGVVALAAGNRIRRLRTNGCRQVTEQGIRRVMWLAGDRLRLLDIRDCPLIRATAINDFICQFPTCVIEHNALPTTN